MRSTGYSPAPTGSSTSPGWYKHGRREHRTLRHVNIDGTRNVLQAAARSGVPRVVYTSTLAVNSDTGGRVVAESYRFAGRHLSEYDRTKAVAHKIALDHTARGLPLVIVQPGVIYGPDDVGSTLGQLTRRIVQGKRVLGPSGGGATFAHVADVARGHVLAMERGRVGESYILAGPTQTYADMLALVARLSGARRRRWSRTPGPPGRAAHRTARAGAADPAVHDRRGRTLRYRHLLRRLVQGPAAAGLERACAGGGHGRDRGLDPPPLNDHSLSSHAADVLG
jgi:nucleoside-diphosphate-sugar epimerase